jgi:NAD-dependent SIR2 family protein deacetylase
MLVDVQCAVCGQNIDTKKEEVTVTTDWLLEETVKMNVVQHEGSFPRVSMVCTKCWKDVLKKKPEDKSFFWTYNKEI